MNQQVRPALFDKEKQDYVLAKNEGAYANIAGDSPDNNPYKSGTNKFNGWADGYAQYDNQMELSNQ